MKSYYSNIKARIECYGKKSPEFDMNLEVRHGCPLSPLPFNFAIDWIMRQTCDRYRGVQISPDLWVTDLAFADDIVILADDLETMPFILDSIVRFASEIGLEINASKTKISSTHSSQTLNMNGHTIDPVSTFKYLGSTLVPNGQAKAEIKQRIDGARTVFLQLMNVL